MVVAAAAVALADAVPADCPDMDSAEDATPDSPYMDSSAPDAIDAGLGIARVCAYATPCKFLSPSSQCYPVEDSDVLASAPVSQYVTATCPAPPTVDADRRWRHANNPLENSWISQSSRFFS